MANAKSGKVIISCAITGSIPTPTMSDALPVTPDEIAKQAIEATLRSLGESQRVNASTAAGGNQRRLHENTAALAGGLQQLVQRRFGMAASVLRSKAFRLTVSNGSSQILFAREVAR